MIKLFIFALQFLTRITIKKDIELKEEDIPKSMIFFPIIGILIGGIQFLIFYATYKFLSTQTIAILLIIAPIMITGAFHLEGFADMMDGFLSKKKKNDIIKIMRDPHIGAIGAISVVIIILAKFIFINEIIAKTNIAKIIITVPCISRWAMVILASCSYYANAPPGIGYPFTKGGLKIMLITSVLPIIMTAIMLKIFSIVIIGIGIFTAFIISRIANKKIYGITGDILGATNEITETILYFIFCWR